MNKRKQIYLILFLFVFIITSSGNLVFGNYSAAQAAKIKISETKLVLSVGQSKSLTITNTAKKVTWTSGEKAIATVSGKGKVTAVAVGHTTITAKMAGKIFTCSVTVVEPNPYLKKVTFKAQEARIGDIDLVIPDQWKVYSQDLGSGYTYTEITPPSSSKHNSIIRIDIRKQEGAPSDYEAFKEAFKVNYSKELLEPQWKEVFGSTKFEIKDIKQSDFEAPFHSVLRTQYTVKAKGTEVEQTNYDFFLGEYIITLRAEDFDKMQLAAITDYVVSSFMVK